MSNTSFSYSSYSAAVRCLRYYKLVYVDKLTPEKAEGGDLAFGSALHSAINSVLTGEDGQLAFELYWSPYKDREVEYGRYGWKDLAQIGDKFIRVFTRLHASRYTLEFAERRLYGNYKGIALEGTMDYLGLFDGRRSLRDFKTSSTNYKQEKGETSLQLNLYSFLAIENGLSAPETLGYTVFNKGTGTIQQMTWDFDKNKMYEALDNLVDYCNIIGGQDKFPKNINACLDYNRKCDFYDVCHKEVK